MRKSSTTTNIDDKYSGLVREYLHKSRTMIVPEILKSKDNRRHSTPSHINFAYKHPMMMAEELKIGGGETLADHKIFNVVDNSSIIIPQSQQQQIRSVSTKSPVDRPRLIGKVTPSIARTWEQITNAMNLNELISDSEDSRVEENDEDKQSYVLFVRKAIDFQQLGNDKFAVNKMHHDIEASERYFDSIDNDEIHGEFEIESCGEEAGEEMAQEIDSLELRCNDLVMWSIES
jgi:hypothetical protein